MNPTGTNPIGLTRAEEEKERETVVSTAKQPAPTGTISCRIVVDDPEKSGNACGAAADGYIVWLPDKDRTPACRDCATNMAARAKAVGSSVRFEPLVRASTRA